MVRFDILLYINTDMGTSSQSVVYTVVLDIPVNHLNGNKLKQNIESTNIPERRLLPFRIKHTNVVSPNFWYIILFSDWSI